MRLSTKNLTALLVCLLLGAWVFWLRWPYFARPAWNLDEGIHATIARSILEGGVMYRDVIDQRTPLTYYLVAGFFRIFGENNMWAVHAALAGMITATALGLFLIGRRWRGPAAGGWAAAVFCACTTNLFYIGDSFSLGTEWFVILFTTWSTWWVWRTWERNSFWASALGGAGFAAAFLSKQPGMLDFGAPLATVLYATATGHLRGTDATRRLAGLCAGFTGLVALVFTYFWTHGALDDLYFYAWSYNLVYYGPETTSGDRVTAAVEAIRIIWQQYPVICAALIAAVFVLLSRLVQKQPSPEERKSNPATFYLLLWALLSWCGASSAGRIYGHYYLQFLPAFTLLAGWLLGDALSLWHDSRGKIVRSLAGLALAAAAWTTVAGPLRGPWPATLVPDAGMDAAGYVRARGQPDDKLFVWGYSPDFYLYADRRPASRYIYCSFLTGLIPWTNIAPERDTRYAIVPGTMDILLRELEANRPEFFVDASRGAGRNFAKYPLTLFPRLATFVAANYLELEPARFRASGYRVLMLKDASRRVPRVLAGGVLAGKPDEPTVRGPTTTDPIPVEYQVQAKHAAGRLQRLELLVDDQPVETLTLGPESVLTVKFVVDFGQLGRGRHRLVARATASSGETCTGPALVVECSPESLPPEQRAAFSLPVITPGLPPERILSSFGAGAELAGGTSVFFVHAPSTLSYTLPPKATRLHGRFGFRPGAYATSNTGHTDGAEFIITLVNADGQRTELLRRLLRPWETPADRGEHPFDITLPTTESGAALELVINAGPTGNTASDWTYWSDLLLSTSR